MATDIWKATTGLISANFAEFAIMIILFIVVSLIIFFVFGAIEGQIIGHFAFGLYGGGYDVGALAITTAIQAALIAVIYLWFMGAFYGLAEAVGGSKKKAVNYVELLVNGFHGALARSKSLLAMGALAFVGGLLATYLGGFGFLATFIQSIFLAGAIGIGLVAFLDQKDQWYNFWDTFSAVNKSSSNAGIFLYITLLAELIPIVNLAEFVLIPLSVFILSQKK